MPPNRLNNIHMNLLFLILSVVVFAEFTANKPRKLKSTNAWSKRDILGVDKLETNYLEGQNPKWNINSGNNNAMHQRKLNSEKKWSRRDLSDANIFEGHGLEKQIGDWSSSQRNKDFSCTRLNCKKSDRSIKRQKKQWRNKEEEDEKNYEDYFSDLLKWSDDKPEESVAKPLE